MLLSDYHNTPNHPTQPNIVNKVKTHISQYLSAKSVIFRSLESDMRGITVDILKSIRI